MKYRSLGKWGIKLSEVSIGTMYYGSHIPRESALKCLKEAVNQGINYIDGADRYGIFDSELPIDQRTRAELIIGEFIKDYERADLVLGTKVFYQFDENNPNSGGLSRKHIREGLHKSLECLGTDYIDIYYCHRPDRSTALEETIQTMSNLIDQGYVNYWGTSWWPPTLIERTIWLAKELGCHPPACEQPPYHLRGRHIERKDEILDIAKYHGLGLVAFEALATGLFTGKYQNNIPEGTRYSINNDIPPEIFEKYRSLIPELQEIAGSIDVSVGNLAIAWTLRHEEITSSLMGASKPEHIVENVKASEVTLNVDVLKQIDQIEGIIERIPSSDYR